MELKNLKTFQVVAKSLNLTKAADILKYSQPTITFHIKSLENEIGHDLFYRVGNKTFLTPEGEKLLLHVNRLFEIIKDIEADLIAKKFYDTITIASNEFYSSNYLSYVISNYVKDFPAIKIKLHTYNNYEILDKVLSGNADLGVIFELDRNITNIGSVFEIPLKKESFLLVTTKEIFDKNNRNTAQILDNYTFLAYSEKYNHMLKSLSDFCLKEISYSPVKVAEFQSEESIKRVLLKQAGIAFLTSMSIKSEVESGSLIVLHKAEQEVGTSLIVSTSKYKHSAFKSFIEVMQETWNQLI